MYSYMLAVGENNELGVDGHLPWHLPSELGYFRKITIGHKIIMGRKTFITLPKVLDDRKHYVLTHDKSFKYDHPEVVICNDLEDVLKETDGEEEVFVIGGAEMFRLFMPYVKRIYITIVHSTFDADTYFFPVDWSGWDLLESWEGVVDKDNPLPHTYYVYERKEV